MLSLVGMPMLVVSTVAVAASPMLSTTSRMLQQQELHHLIEHLLSVRPIWLGGTYTRCLHVWHDMTGCTRVAYRPTPIVGRTRRAAKAGPSV